jgi:hypothetical protein
MQSVRDNIKSENHSVQKSDITTFFKVARFVLAFQHEKSSNDQVWNIARRLVVPHLFKCYYRFSFAFSFLCNCDDLNCQASHLHK